MSLAEGCPGYIYISYTIIEIQVVFHFRIQEILILVRINGGICAKWYNAPLKPKAIAVCRAFQDHSPESRLRRRNCS